MVSRVVFWSLTSAMVLASAWLIVSAGKAFSVGDLFTGAPMTAQAVEGLFFMVLFGVGSTLTGLDLLRWMNGRQTAQLQSEPTRDR